MNGKRCGYAVVDDDGEQQPCDRPATGWRWYQDCDHEDTLDVACSLHVNEGGRRLAAAEMAQAGDFDSLVRTIYLDLCPSAWLDVGFDQWWRFTIECEHGKWRAVSNGLGDPTQGLTRTLDLAKNGHPR